MIKYGKVNFRKEYSKYKRQQKPRHGHRMIGIRCRILSGPIGQSER